MYDDEVLAVGVEGETEDDVTLSSVGVAGGTAASSGGAEAASRTEAASTLSIMADATVSRYEVLPGPLTEVDVLNASR